MDTNIKPISVQDDAINAVRDALRDMGYTRNDCRRNLNTNGVTTMETLIWTTLFITLVIVVPLAAHSRVYSSPSPGPALALVGVIIWALLFGAFHPIF